MAWKMLKPGGFPEQTERFMEVPANDAALANNFVLSLGALQVLGGIHMARVDVTVDLDAARVKVAINPRGLYRISAQVIVCSELRCLLDNRTKVILPMHAHGKGFVVFDLGPAVSHRAIALSAVNGEHEDKETSDG